MLLESGEFWKLMKRYDDEGFLLSGSTPGEERWNDSNDHENDGNLLPGHSYSVIQVREVQSHKLLNIRNPWGNFEWTGRWSDNSPEWTEQIKEDV